MVKKGIGFVYFIRAISLITFEQKPGWRRRPTPAGTESDEKESPQIQKLQAAIQNMGIGRSCSSECR